MLRSLFLIALFSTLVLASAPSSSPYTANFVTGPAAVKSIGNLTFGPEGILFVGDSIGATVFALDLNDRTPSKADKVEIDDVEAKIGSLLGTDAADVLVHDMAVNPISKNIYLSVSRGRGDWNNPWQLPNDVTSANLLLKITPAGNMSEVALDNISHSKVQLPNPVNDTEKVEWKKSKLRVDAISDMAFADDRLYVAGLSNEEFSSTMRVFNFPFGGDVASSSLEVFHGAHGKYETHSPVRAFLPYDLNGKKHILAAYLCTPLAVFPVDDIKDKAHVRGRTLAELGSGNYPLDMVTYKKNGKPYIFLSNSARPLMRFDVEEINKSKHELKTQSGPGTGMPFDHLRGQGYLQVDSFNEETILVLARGANGKLDMGTISSRWL